MRTTEHAPRGWCHILERPRSLPLIKRLSAQIVLLNLRDQNLRLVFVRGKAGFAALAEGLRDFAHKETVSDLAGLDGAFVGQRERDNWATINS